MSKEARTLFALLLTVIVVAIVVLPPKCDGPPSPPEASVPMSAHAVPRSGKWPAVRKHYVDAHPTCEACGRTAKQSGQAIECHHRIPFSADESKELDPANLISLCRRCHELIGHLDSWKSHNPDIAEDADRLMDKIKRRPQ